jgi:DNA-binding MarR family transcriptional regulator
MISTTPKAGNPMDDLKNKTSMSSLSNRSARKPWTFVTNHTQVLLAISRDGDMRLRDIALVVGITERATQRIVSDLIEGGYVKRDRVGRRNHYVVNPEIKMRHPAQREQGVGTLLAVLEQVTDERAAGWPD